MDLLDPVYMVRDYAFGRDFTPKFFTALIAIGFVVWDWVKQKRLDYVWVFVFGTVIWGGAEAFLKLQGVRDMPDRELFGEPINLQLSYVIQGMSEGAFVAVVGLFLGDRWLCRSSRNRSIILTTVVVLGIALATVRSSRRLEGFGDAGSRRDVFDEQALLALGFLVILGLLFYWRYPDWRPRTLAMFIMMLVIGTGWTIAQVLVDGRWVEVPGPTPGTYEPAGPLLSLFVLAFDVVVEIALAYVPFLGLPVMLKLIRDTTPLPTCADGEVTGQVDATPPASPSVP